MSFCMISYKPVHVNALHWGRLIRSRATRLKNSANLQIKIYLIMLTHLLLNSADFHSGSALKNWTKKSADSVCVCSWDISNLFGVLRSGIDTLRAKFHIWSQPAFLGDTPAEHYSFYTVKARLKPLKWLSWHDKRWQCIFCLTHSMRKEFKDPGRKLQHK